MNTPPKTIVSNNKGNVKVLQWDNGGKTLVYRTPPPKDAPKDTPWPEQRINYRFNDIAEAIIEVVERDLSGEIGEALAPRAEQPSTNARRPQQGFREETQDYRHGDSDAPAPSRPPQGRSSYRR